jgi:hypothetical protein
MRFLLLLALQAPFVDHPVPAITDGAHAQLLALWLAREQTDSMVACALGGVDSSGSVGRYVFVDSVSTDDAACNAPRTVGAIILVQRRESGEDYYRPYAQGLLARRPDLIFLAVAWDTTRVFVQRRLVLTLRLFAWVRTKPRPMNGDPLRRSH